ncbi:polyketide synthase dehydratase-domain-containing protein [Aspergillus oleicola]
MNEIVENYRTVMGELQPEGRSVSVPMISTVTQDIVTAKTLCSPDYWIRNLTSTVEFEGALSRVLRSQLHTSPLKRLGGITQSSDIRITQLLEIGPHKALEGPINEILRATPKGKATAPTYIPLLVRHNNARSFLLAALGKLYCAGYAVDILSVNGIPETPTRPMPVDMPAYSFNHGKSYWREGRLSHNFRFRARPRHDLLGTRSVDWNVQVAQWRNILRVKEVPWLRDHKIDGQIIMPAMGMVVMAVEALREVLSNITEAKLSTIELEDVSFLHPISFLQDTEQVETQVTLSTSSTPGHLVWSQFRTFAMETGSYVECCRGFIRGALDAAERPAPMMASDTFERLVAEASEGQIRDPYTMSTGSTVEYGPCFQNVAGMRLGPDGQAVATVQTNTWKADGAISLEYVVHPCTMNGLAQLLVPALVEAGGGKHLPTMVPVRTASIWIDCSDLGLLQEDQLLVAAECRTEGSRGAKADIVCAGMTERVQKSIRL